MSDFLLKHDPQSGQEYAFTYRADILMVWMIPALNVETGEWNFTPGTLSFL